jgi:hypothetical protein
VAVTAPVIPSDLAREKLARIHLPGARYDVSPEVFAGWLGGLELVPPGVAPAAGLRPGWADAVAVPCGKPYVIAGLGRKRG